MPKITGIDKSGLPIGVPAAVPYDSNLPVNTLLCDGTVHLVATYPKLAAKLGDLYGGDGVTNFGVPDLRGRSVFGMDDMTPAGSAQGPAGIVGNAAADVAGGTLGAENHNLSLTEVPSHNHGGGGHNHNLYIGQLPGGGALRGWSLEGSTFSSFNSGTELVQTSSNIVSSNGGDTPHNNMQPAMAMVWVIPFV